MHTDEDITQAADRLEHWLDELDPDTVEATNTEDLRAVAEAADAVAAAEARLREAVQIARAHEWSWNRIGVALGVSRQAARQRFSEKLSVGRWRSADTGR